MELTVEYLRQRHAYWIERLADAEISNYAMNVTSNGYDL